MGRKWERFSSVRRAFIPYCCRGDLKNSLDSSKVSDSSHTKEVETTVVDSAQPSVAAPIQEVKLIVKEEEESKHAYSVALTSAVALEAAAFAAQAAAEVIRLTTSASRHTGESRKEIAVVKIQNAYRRYKVHVIVFSYLPLFIVLSGKINHKFGQKSLTKQCLDFGYVTGEVYRIAIEGVNRFYI